MDTNKQDRPAGRLTALLAALWLCAGAGQGVVAPPAAELQADGSLIFELDFPPLSVAEERVHGRAWHRLTMEGAAWAGLPGEPELPAFHQLIEIPDRSGVRLEVLEQVEEPLDGLHPFPLQDDVPGGPASPSSWREDAAIYGADAEWPGRLTELGRPLLLRDRRLVLACFYPVQVNPVSGAGRVLRHLRVRVVFEGEDLENAGRGPLKDPTPVLDAVIRPQVLAVDADAATDLEDLAFDPGRLPGHYLVFAHSAALDVPALQDYLQWKRRRGHLVTVVSEAEVAFTPSALRNRIIAELSGPDPVDFVLLVGDTDGAFALPTDAVSCDHYYARIIGNDILGDVAVGRLSCQDAGQLAVICHKIRGYESAPFLDDDAWLGHAHLHTSCGLGAQILSRNIAAELAQRRGYDDLDSAYCESSQHVLEWFQAGLSVYNHSGEEGLWGLEPYDVQALAQGPRTPVVTLLSGGSGSGFDVGATSLAEAFLRAGLPYNPGGAVACAGLATSSAHERYTNVLTGGWYAALLEHDVPEAGACLLNGKLELFRTLPPSDQASASNYANWANLMGDPGTCQWIGRLSPLEVEGLPNRLASGADHLELTVTSGGAPVSEAAICAYQDQGAGQVLQATLLASADGRVLLPLTGLQDGTLMVTVTHRRHVPLLADLPVGPAVADAALTDFMLPGDALQPGAGAQDVELSLRNTGTGSLGGLELSFSLDEAYGQLTAPAQFPADLAPGAGLTLTDVSLSPAADLGDGGHVPLRVQVAYAEGSFTRTAWLPLAAPSPSLTGTSTPDGPLAPGQTRTLRLGLRNLGSRSAGGLMVGLASDNPLFGQVTSPPQPAGDLAPGGAVEVDFSVLIEVRTPVGCQLPLALDWTTLGGATGRSELLVTVGLPSQGDPTGPDHYGYWAFEDDDNGYESAPVYAWIPVAPSEGGAGTEIPLTDDGDELDDALVVPLPFVFTFYGVAYSEALVCSNGFIAFDDAGYGEVDFRNHYLPGAMGPDAMIAPMWDDHLTSGAAGVWQWFDAAEHRFVIEWKDLPANPSGGPNTFQLVLYDPLHHPTLTGDGPFLFQYQDFNDTQSAGSDFPYCTVGFKDETSTRGMTLLNSHLGVPTLHGVSDHTAIYFTTSPFILPDDVTAAPLPWRTELAEAWPNPFNPSTTLAWNLAASGLVSLRVYDLAGREVAVLLDGPAAAGSHRALFDGSRLASGIYFARLEAGGGSQTRRLILLK